jgi:medium-chain acyl-[acyl-carrier-protein] hydrolase
LRLFCFPYAGAGSVIYRLWPQSLPTAVEVWGVRLPGRSTRLAEPAFTRLAPLVAALKRIMPPYLDVPFAFFGHSMGGLLSYELVQTLRREHHPVPVHLFISAHRAPHLPHRLPPIHLLPEPELIVQLRHLNGTPEAVLQNAELLQLLLPTLRADLAVCETYTYSVREPLTCPVSVFGGVYDTQVHADELAAWRGHTYGAFRQQMFPGDHFFLHSAQTLLLQALRQDLATYLRCGRPGSGGASDRRFPA